MDTLPRPAPDDPLPLAQRWLDDAEARVERNPWAMALATTAASGRPSVRYVLLKSLSTAEGFVVFYTNYGSRKATELAATGHAAGALYWPEAGRQLRFEGRVERSPVSESNAYFASRPRQSQLNAWASAQSRPIVAPELMRKRLAEQTAAFTNDASLPRPDHWGGFRLVIDAVEFWLEGADRFHERLRYERGADRHWASDWLQP
jgi:pyridoxamine 5'-phosphate oxidase